MIAALALLAAAAAPTCTPVPGADALWRPENRWIVIGEMHGTTETPAAFLNLACLAARSGRPVTVAFEYRSEWQAALDAFLASDGGPAARAALLALPVWRWPTQEGRGSRAFLALFERLRRLRQAGTIASVVASDRGAAAGDHVDASHSGAARDAAMAQAWQAIPLPTNGLALILVGDFHAIRRPIDRPQMRFLPAASLLPPAQAITVDVRGNGGTAWVCMADGCGVHPNGPARQAAAGIAPIDNSERRWDMVYELGVPTTAPPPAVEATPPIPPSP